MQITSAMKMVSAAKLKKAQDAITAMRPYAEKLTEFLQNLSATLDGDTGSKYSDQREVNKVLWLLLPRTEVWVELLIRILSRKPELLANETYADKKVDFFTIGKKGNDILKKTGKVVENNNAIFDDLTFDNASEIAEDLMELFAEGTYDKIVLVYNNFKNAATQIVMNEQFLPILPPQRFRNQGAVPIIFLNLQK